MNVLLISLYELGRQPVHVASPAAVLRQSGHHVDVRDLSIGELDSQSLDKADAVAISVPMHTAKRMGDDLTSQIKSYRPDLPVAHYGLYASVGNGLDRGLLDAEMVGEYEPALLSWVQEISTSGGADKVVSQHLGRSDAAKPDRTGLPDLASYAHLEWNGVSVPVGAVEASHGCRHRCRHCPIPAVYDGRMRVVPQDLVLEDINQLVDAGARHITFGDADFLNAPPHSKSILELAHASHPEVTFDATVKVEHILNYEDVWKNLGEQNLLFLVSAFESVDQRTLDILDKGHTVDDMAKATSLVRSAGIHIRPTWLPFLPWTKADHVSSLLRFIVDNDLSGATDPVQLAIKLLVPQGSLLEDHPDMVPYLSDYDAEGLTWRWRFADAEVDVLQKEIEAIASEASDCGQEVGTTLEAIWTTVVQRTGQDVGTLPSRPGVAPRLTESWFCCAEPTSTQTTTLQIGLN